VNLTDGNEAVWTGLADTRPRVADDEGAAGAYIRVVGRACSRQAFHALVEYSLPDIGFDLVALEESEAVDLTRVPPEFADLVALASGGGLAYGTIHTYDVEE
jgi:hypothetical protein